MKKFLLFSVLVLAISVNLFAQTIPNSGFETWSGGEPQGWFTTNAISNSTAHEPNVVPDSFVVHTGKYSIDLYTVSPGFGAIPGAAVAGTGVVNGLSVYPAGGFPYVTRAMALTGFFEYTPGSASDSCLIQAWLFQRNPSTHNRDTIAWLTYKNGNTISSFQQFTSNFTYHAGSIGNETPDSALILLCSSHVLSISGISVGSNLHVDDIAFSGNVATGIKNVNKDNSTISIYPNPATNEVTFKTNLSGVTKINVFDVLGKKVKSVYVNGATTTFPVNDLNNGLYFYQLMSEREEVLTTGRFSVKN